MARSLRNRILFWHISSLALVALLLSGSFFFGLKRSRDREIDFEMEGAGESLITLLKALPAFELRDETEGVPPEVLRRRRQLERERSRESTNRSTNIDRERGVFEPDPPFGLPRGPERLMQSLELPPAFVERHRRREGLLPYFVVLRGDGTRMTASSNAPATLTPPDKQPNLIPPMSFRARIPVEQRGNWREMWLTGPENSRVIVGRSTVAEDGEMNRWLWTIMLLTAGILGLSCLTAWWISARVVQSLQRISNEAAMLSLDKLDHRIDVGQADLELKGLIDTLNQTYQHLADAFERQRRFTSDASHELRTPLTIILGNLELALLNESLESGDRESLEAAQRAAKRMKNLMEHLLMLARADAGKLTIQNDQCDLATMIEECRQLLAPLAQEKNIRWQLDLNAAHVVGDAKLLNQVFINLISNAIHYNRCDGEIHLSVHADGEMVVVHVRDTGIGIAAEVLPHIFERFYRQDTSRSTQSTNSRLPASHGLGLAITESIVKAHGGEIHATSELGVGSEFVVRIPSARIQNPES